MLIKSGQRYVTNNGGMTSTINGRMTSKLTQRKSRLGTKMIQGAMTIIKGITTTILSTDECSNDASAASASSVSVSVSPVKAPRQKK
jgi:hypothetical protein